jgi:hypothetical protein
MIKAISFLFKLTLFSILVLVLGNMLKIGDRTISDQVKTELAHAERSEFAAKLKNWASQITTDSRVGSQIKAKVEQFSGASSGASSSAHDSSSSSRMTDRISPSERQKLKNLLQELNPPGGR